MENSIFRVAVSLEIAFRASLGIRIVEVGTVWTRGPSPDYQFR